MALCGGRTGQGSGAMILLPLIPVWLLLAIILGIRVYEASESPAPSCECPVLPQRCVCLHGVCYKLERTLDDKRPPLAHDPTEFNEHLWESIGFKPGAFVGQGGFGEVWLAKRICDTENNHEYVIKKVKVEHREEWQREAYFGETLRGVAHVARFVSAAEEHGYLWLVFLYEGKSLYKLVNEQHIAGFMTKTKWWSEKKKSGDEFADVMFQLFEVLHELHSRGITHRDIKLENVLLDDNGILNIIDFGSAVDAHTRTNLYNLQPISKDQETPRSSPPEVWFTESREDISGAYDMWSAGILFLELKHGNLGAMSTLAKHRAILLKNLRGVEPALQSKALRLLELRNICVQFLDLELDLKPSWFPPVQCDDERLRERLQSYDDAQARPTDRDITFIRRVFHYEPHSRMTALQAKQLWSQ